MGILVFLPFALLWYLPLFAKHRKTVREKGRYYFFAFLMGAVAFIAAVIVQGLCNTATMNIKPTGIAYDLYGFTKVLLVVAAGEELLKFFFGNLILKKVPDLTEAGSMLILGMTGFGFEVVESLSAADPLGAVFRGLTALHIFFQMWMGKYWWQAQQAKQLGDRETYKQKKRKAFLTPILMHAFFDYPILRASKLLNQPEDPNQTVMIIAIVAAGAAVLFGIGCMVFLYRTAWRTLKEERAAYEASLAEAMQTAAAQDTDGTAPAEPVVSGPEDGPAANTEPPVTE